MLSATRDKLIVVVMVLLVGWLVWKEVKSYRLQSELDSLLAEKGKSTLDLVQLKSIEWDQAQLLKPEEFNYKELALILFLEFVDLSELAELIESSDLASVCRFAFLKNGKKVGEAKLDQEKVDFCGSNLPRLFPRSKMRFHYVRGGAFTRVALEDSLWLQDYTEFVEKRFELTQPTGDKPYCRVFETGVGSCYFMTFEDCNSKLDPIRSDIACVANKPGIVTTVTFKKSLNDNLLSKF